MAKLIDLPEFSVLSLRSIELVASGTVRGWLSSSLSTLFSTSMTSEVTVNGNKLLTWFPVY